MSDKEQFKLINEIIENAKPFSLKYIIQLEEDKILNKKISSDNNISASDYYKLKRAQRLIKKHSDK